MARTFVAASSQYCEASAGPLGAGTISVFAISCWFKPSTIANGTAWSFGSSASGAYLALGMNGSGNAFMEVSDGSGSDDVLSTGTLTAGTWAHLLGVQVSSTSRTIYLNGVQGGSNTSGSSPVGIDRTTAGALEIGGSRVSFQSGDIGECAIWNVALDQTAATNLAAGRLADTVQAANLVTYMMRARDAPASPEPDHGSAGLSFTVSGATAAGSNPPVDSVNPPFLILPPPIAAGPSYAAHRAASI